MYVIYGLNMLDDKMGMMSAKVRDDTFFSRFSITTIF